MSTVRLSSRKILAVGSMALDSVKTPFGQVRDALGGSVTYFSVSARFFSHVSVVAVVGSDFPPKHLTLLRRLGVNTGNVSIAKGRTFRWQGEYNYDLNTARTIKTELNVFADFKPVILPENRRSHVVFLANIHPEIQHSVLSQVDKPALTACDTMNYWIQSQKKSLESLLKRVDVFLCNDAEAREFTGEYSLAKAARQILTGGPKIVVIKKGEDGVLCFTRDFIFSAPAFLLEKVYDPTGAGDTFAGGFIGYLSSAPKITSQAIRKAIVYGTVMASYNVESFSLTKLAGLKAPDIAKRYRDFRLLTRF